MNHGGFAIMIQTKFCRTSELMTKGQLEGKIKARSSFVKRIMSRVPAHALRLMTCGQSPHHPRFARMTWSQSDHH
jgi:hypothetical protein